MGPGHDHLLLDRRILLGRCGATFELLGLLTALVLALLGVALEACEGLRQILQRKVLQEHSEADAYVGGASDALGASTRSECLGTMHGCGPLHQGFPEVRIVQVLLEKTLEVLPNVDVDLLALSQVLDLLLQNHGLQLVFLESLDGTILTCSSRQGLSGFNFRLLRASRSTSVHLAWSDLICAGRFRFCLGSPGWALPETSCTRCPIVIALGRLPITDGVFVRDDVLLPLVLLEAVQQVDHVNELLKLLHLLFVGRRLGLLLGPALSLGFLEVLLLLVGAYHILVRSVRCMIRLLKAVGLPCSHLLTVDDVHLCRLTNGRTS